ncbi:hypothetical protein TNCV_2540081 [Trichonephila clavipes]|nr:hypothetical protein TNCV_2540081 [Trichonephila clavipes]
MSVQKFLKLDATLKFLNSINSDESDDEIVLCYQQIPMNKHEDEGNANVVNTGEIILNNVPGCLEVRSRDYFQPEPSTSFSL